MEPEPILPAPAAVQGEGVMPPQQSQETPVLGGERGSVSPETAAKMSPLTQPATQAAPVQPVALVSNPSQMQGLAQPGQPGSSNPTVADDVDVIEKEWVDKAKKIVSTTKDNPHLQEKEVSRLQADYLMKRYGKKVKLTE